MNARLRVSLRAGEAARDLTEAAIGSSLLHFLRSGDLAAATFLLAQLPIEHALWRSGQEQLLHACHAHSDFLHMDATARAVLAQDAAHAFARRALALALRYQNRHEEAIALLSRDVNNTDTGLKNILAILHKEHGASAPAKQLLSENLQATDLHAESFWNYADAFGSLPEAARQRAEQALEKDLPDCDRAHLHFALGRHAETSGDQANAVQHYRLGGQAKRHSQRYQHADELESYRRIQTLCTAERIAAARSSLQSAAPIFICGLPRSGTSLLEHMLAAHPQVIGGGELVEISVATTGVQRRSAALQSAWPDWFAQLNGADASAIGEAYLQRTRWLQRTQGLKTGAHFTDKMPAHSKGLGVLAAALPQAKIIWCARHPLANAIGCFRQLFVDAAPWSYSESELVDVLRAHCALLQHWQRVLSPTQLHTLHYETLVQAPEASLRRLLAFLDLPWDAACLHFQQQARNVRTQSSQQVRRGLHSDNLDSWQDWAPRLPQLQTGLADLAEAYASAQQADLQALLRT